MSTQLQERACMAHRCLCKTADARIACDAKPVPWGGAMRFCTRPAYHEGPHFCCGRVSWQDGEAPQRIDYAPEPRGLRFGECADDPVVPETPERAAKRRELADEIAQNMKRAILDLRHTPQPEPEVTVRRILRITYSVPGEDGEPVSRSAEIPVELPADAVAALRPAPEFVPDPRVYSGMEIATEETWGTRPGSGDWKRIPIVSEALADPVARRAMRALALQSRTVAAPCGCKVRVPVNRFADETRHRQCKHGVWLVELRRGEDVTWTATRRASRPRGRRLPMPGVRP